MISKVLIVEDSPLLRKILHEAIRSAGFIPYEAENGRNGLTSVREITPDIILLDVLMPVMDGMMMYEELRKETWGETVPVIMLTSSEGTEIQNWITEQRLDTVKKDDEMIVNVIARIESHLQRE